MGNWIKISRDLRKHWLWSDAVRLQWWLDLLFMASWEDHSELVQGRLVDIKRGEVIASNEFLKQRWNVCDKTIRKFLKMLEEDMMIMRTVHPKYCMITVCNYDRYQTDDSDDVHPSVPLTAHPKNDTLTSKNVHPSIHHLTDKNTMSYETEDVANVHPSVPLTAHPIAHPIKEYKEDYIDNIKNKQKDSEENQLEQLFEDFRKKYPGRKRGHDTEFEAFKRKHKKWVSIVPKLMPALERLIAYNNAAKEAGQFVPCYANLSTWLHQARWEEELPEIKSCKQQLQTNILQTSCNYDDEDAAFVSKNR